MGGEFEMCGIIENFDLCLGFKKKKEKKIGVLFIQFVGLTKIRRLVKTKCQDLKR